MKSRFVALVPMRHHSQRVPDKNFRPCAGRPLFHHILRTLGDCPEIAQTVVDTDSPVIRREIRQHFPEVTLLERPERLQGATVPMNEILLHDTSLIESDFYLQTHSTNPLLRSDTIRRALQTFLANYPACDSLFSVTRLQTRLWDGLGRPLNHNPEILIQTQDLPPVFEENSCLYIFTRETLVDRRNRLGRKPLMFEIGAPEALDIDEEIDFLIADFLLSRRQEGE